MLTEGFRTEPLTAEEFGCKLASLGRFEIRPFLAVAVSGGPDSLALALLADRWSRQRGGEICALTVDHRLRPESGAETRLVGEWLSARGIRHEVLIWSGEKPKTGIQEAARNARYRLLAGWCREQGCLHLLTAHHREDQIETHMIRQRAHSGPDGLAGISAIRELADCRLLRPLLGVSKARLLALLEVERQPFITDPSNFDIAFERGRLRGGGVRVPGAADPAALLAAIGTLGAERQARQSGVDALLSQFVYLHPAGFAVLDPGLVRTVPDEMAARVLSAVVATIGGARYPARGKSIARLRDLLRLAARRGHTLGGCRFVRWRERVLVVREIAEAAQPVRLYPGTRVFWDRRYEVVLPPGGAHPLTIGYLGSPGAAHLNWQEAQPERRRLPRLLFPILPAAWDADGIAAVPSLGYRREGVAVLPEFVFRPATPLTQAGFAVV